MMTCQVSVIIKVFMDREQHIPAYCGAWHGADNSRPPTPHETAPAKLLLNDASSIENAAYIPDFGLLAEASCL